MSVNIAPREKGVPMLKPWNLLQEMDDNDENIFCTSTLDGCMSRPENLVNTSLVEFAATCTTGERDGLSDAADHIPNVLDGSYRNDVGSDQEDDEEASNRYRSVITLHNGPHEKAPEPLCHQVRKIIVYHILNKSD